MTPGFTLMKHLIVLALVALTLSACGGSGQDSEPPTVLVGVDGGEWQVIDQMIADGELPNFAKIKNEGAWGHLINNGMEVSPVVWTTFATGHFARQHGVLDHVFPFDGEGARRPVTSELRRVPALWNVATHYGLRSIVVGYFVTHPAEPIDGVMVSSQAPILAPDSLYPEDALDVQSHYYSDLLNPALNNHIWAPYFGWDYDRAQADDPESPYQVAAATVRERALDARVVRDEFLRRAVAELSEQPSDLFIAYYRIPDFMSHSLWRYYDTEAFADNPPSEEELEWFGESVPQSYRFVDQALGELMEFWDGKANIVIVSDHGFGRAADAKMEDENARVKYLSGDHRANGIVLATGPDIQPGEIEGLTIMEIAPTIAAMMGVPVSGELPGEVAYDLFKPEFFDNNPIKSVADYSQVEIPLRNVVLDQQVQEEEMDALRGLGYVGEGVEFDVSSAAGEYNFWGASERLVAGHIASEVMYYLLKGDTESAEFAYGLLEENRPDAVRRTWAYVWHKTDMLKQRLPEGSVDFTAADAFVEKHRDR